jgi:transcription antitermination factor NusA-like protein
MSGILASLPQRPQVRRTVVSFASVISQNRIGHARQFTVEILPGTGRTLFGSRFFVSTKSCSGAIMANKEPETVKAECEQIRQLFERFVPEVASGAVLIKAIAREPSYRTKVALQSLDPAIDAVRVCVGKLRKVESDGETQCVPDGPIKAIVDELGGERIELVRWYDSLEMLVPPAMLPAKIDQVFLYPRLGRVIVLVKDEDQLALAIGGDGTNVRLASKLIGWDIEIMTPAELNEVIGRAENWFRQIPGVTDKVVEVFIKEGFLSYDDLTFLKAAQLANMAGVTQQEARAMLSFAEQAAQRVEAEAQAEVGADLEPRDVPAPSEPELVFPGALEKSCGVILALIGIVLVPGSFVLYLGNRTGFFPTFPFAGGTTFLVGWALILFGLRMAGPSRVHNR